MEYKFNSWILYYFDIVVDSSVVVIAHYESQACRRCHLVAIMGLTLSNVLMAGGSYGAVVKAACLKSQISRVRAPLWPSSFKETKCVFPAHSFNIVGSLRDREVACSASDREEVTLA